MPCFTGVPPRGDHPMHGHFWMPIDDDNCWAWSYDYHPMRALTARRGRAMKAGKGVHCKYVPGTYRPLANKDNDYLMDREAQTASAPPIQRHRGHRDPGLLAAGEHGADRRPHEGKPRRLRQRHHHGASQADARRQGACARRAASRPASIGGSAEGALRPRCCCKRDVHYKDGAKEALKAKKGVPQTTV